MAEALKARIFQVDDNIEGLKIMRKLLGSHDHDVVLIATTVAQALSYIPDILIEKKVNLALVDGNLPDGSGDQVAQAIRDSGLPISIIALSARQQKFGDQNLNKGEGLRPILQAINSLLK